MLVFVLSLIHEWRSKHEVEIERLVVLVETWKNFANVIIDIDCIEFLRIEVLHENFWFAILLAVDGDEIFKAIELGDYKVLVAHAGCKKVFPLLKGRHFSIDQLVVWECR